MQGEFCQKLPPWVYGGVQLEGASLLYIKVGDYFGISVRRGEFSRRGRIAFQESILIRLAFGRPYGGNRPRDVGSETAGAKT